MPKSDITSSSKPTCRHSVGKESIAIIALGNLSRRDDGVALRVLEALQTNRFLTNVCFFPLGTFNNMLAECLVGHDYALIMDSMDSGSPPGTVYTVDLLAAADDLVPPRTHASHGLSFMDELSLIPKDRLPKTVLFIGIEACDNGYGDELSEHLNERLKDIAAQISEVIAGLRASSPRNA